MALDQSPYARRIRLSEECEAAARNLAEEMIQLAYSEREIRAALAKGSTMLQVCAEDQIDARTPPGWHSLT
jgi:hypothetical protein